LNSKSSSITILNVSPQVDCGRFSAKRIQGDILDVGADVLKPGHEIVAANLVWRMRANEFWNLESMDYSLDDDRWSAKIKLDRLGTMEYFIEAWNDRFSKTIADAKRWLAHGEDVSSELSNLIEFANEAKGNASPAEKSLIGEALNQSLEIEGSQTDVDTTERIVAILSSEPYSSLIIKNLEKKDYSRTQVFSIIVDRLVARFSTWYEMFHRSQGKLEGKSATFKDCEDRLVEIKNMGFNIIYLPPIHPIGRTNRRGPNNSISDSPTDPGSLWAIGNEFGGHDSVNPELGTLAEFDDFVSKASTMDFEIALDLAFQVSPDHPYVKQHPEWFFHRSDGSIKFAENPPKRYYDIYPLNFENDDWKSLWDELKRIVEFWIQHGVRIFRVDNPHTKPVPFWEWLISTVRAQHPETVFLAEAFTSPKLMKLLAKAGFDQSYTYFTWKNNKYELTGFVDEFLLSDVSEYYRPNFFTNTPDILSEFLQTGGRPAFKIRETLAGTLSSSYGIYNGFELCENVPVAKGSEEYMNSEKYQYKVWDWDRPGNIKAYISKINRIRSENEALHCNSSLRLLKSDSDQIMFYGKWMEDLSNILLVAVNLDPHQPHDAIVSVPVDDLHLKGSYVVRDLITDTSFVWNGERNYVRLDPNQEPAHILKIVR